MNLILLFPEDFKDTTHVRLSDYRADHIRDILRSYKGQTLRVGFVNGGVGEGTITVLAKNSVELKVSIPHQKPLVPPLSLILALPRPQTLKKVLEVSATFGIRQLLLINAERVEKSFFSSKLLKDEAWKKHIRLGLEQGGQTFFPEIKIYHSLHNFFSEVLPTLMTSSPIKLLATPDTKSSLWETPLASTHEKKGVFCALGPEGGWRKEETESFERRGFQKICLGTPILRVENAVCALFSQIKLLSLRPYHTKPAPKKK